jgi:hypothetical protein
MKTKVLTITLLLASTVATALFLSACQGEFNETKADAFTMQTGKEYTVYPGDTVAPDGEANISVKHQLSTDTKSVTLLSGKATFLRGDYHLNN